MSETYIENNALIHVKIEDNQNECLVIPGFDGMSGLRAPWLVGGREIKTVFLFRPLGSDLTISPLNRFDVKF